MKGGYLMLVLWVSFFLKSEERAKPQGIDDCTFKGKKLYGRVKLVEYASEADIKVKIVNSFPDLKVQFVGSFSDECGQWKIVDSNEDLKVYITESFPDIKIQAVTSF
ncbi:hypothetical protein HN014_11200 [Aquimarina sp. TRL1]|uniref:hypothetical protein n=1 Tax=Aquimarina sp. (strain TRL1) TaxID=2736252 RepID=UPI0015882F99|nr:hypothetical protein [Aquimarina sp. TRL1]QKX05456.1 hypothetical protein HN014_11200 [Aquimarina sp. TRL1]